MRLARGRTWGRRGTIPVVKVMAAGTKRVSTAVLICTRPGCQARLIYRIHRDHGPAQGGRKGFTETDYARLLDTARQQLGGPMVIALDHLNTHVSAKMKQLTTARPWLTVFQLPRYAPELNPVEAVWSRLKRSLANLAKRGHQPAGRSAQDPAREDAIPARPHRRLRRQDRTRPHTHVTPAINDL